MENDALHKDEEQSVTYDFLKLARAGNSSDLLKQMSFRVDISKLYSVCASQSCNSANPQFAVQLKVNDLSLIEHYGGRYLVQLWNNNREIVYQRVRNEPVTNRNLIDNWLIFQEDKTMVDGTPFEFSGGFQSKDNERYTIIKLCEEN